MLPTDKEFRQKFGSTKFIDSIKQDIVNFCFVLINECTYLQTLVVFTFIRTFVKLKYIPYLFRFTSFLKLVRNCSTLLNGM